MISSNRKEGVEDKTGMRGVRDWIGVLGWLVIVLFMGEASLRAAEQAVIIGLKVPEGLAAQGTVSALAAEIEERGGRVEYAFKLIDAVAARVSEEALARLKEDPKVRYVAPDGLVATPEFWAGDALLRPEPSSLLGAATPVELYSWGVERVRAPKVHQAQLVGASAALLALALLGMVGRARRRRWGLVPITLLLGSLALLSGCTVALVLPPPGIMGEGVEVALLDTGVDLKHPDLKANILGGIDLVNDDNDPQDDNGHGTGVAGILAARENGLGLIGVAPEVGLWAIKMLRYDEQGSISDLIRGIEWALERGVQIIAMSLGTEEDNFALREAIRAAYQAGVLLVAAAGNKGMRVLFPAAYPEVIAVAATDRNDRRAWFSNTGPEVELSAPGTELLSTGLEGGYQVVNGTSFAVPHVSGVAALLFSAGLVDASEVRRRLAETAEDLGLAITAQGYGLVDAERAVLGLR